MQHPADRLWWIQREALLPHESTIAHESCPAAAISPAACNALYCTAFLYLRLDLCFIGSKPQPQQ